MALGYTIYLRQPAFEECDHRDVLLVLHELVHVAQFARGTSLDFAREYAAGLLRHLSYRANPLEREAEAFTQAHAPDVSRALAQVCGGSPNMA